MSRILFAWELGANLGHLARDLPVAEVLRKQGHDVLFSGKDLRVAEQVLSPAGFKFVQAPAAASTPQDSYAPANYSEMLIGAGYGDVLGTLARVKAWAALFDLHRTDVVVINHAPTALLAARALGLPAVLTCIGFELPPAVSPLPSIRPWESIPVERLQQADSVVLHTFNSVLDRFGQAPILRVADLFTNLPTVLTTFPELDHHGARTDVLYVGPVSMLTNAVECPWPAGASRRIFAYLRPSVPGFEHMLAALRDTAATVLCVSPGISGDDIKRLSSPRLKILPHPVALNATLQGVDLAVVYGTGTMADALLAGVPLLMVPQVIEQALAARRIEDLGAGIMWKPPRTLESARTVLAAALSTSSLKQKADLFAKRYQGVSQDEATGGIARIVSDASLIGQRCQQTRQNL
ncbi:glycosyltransferase [Ralstonia solanacearum]|uniref:UDP-glucuronosyltransferase n=1 Tax=Ralstonia solanacearum TaxID=305 RepID=A0AAE3NHK8_RALSL|nr:UDP-glucuronosyltransferase [Ralstonia solanacearum]MBB6581160.1 UDP-glucuronosyltransferase [Ralstonia solanacearum]MDB0521149.1 UDP-glucuronosyltransferase [Ralstonia solanacearum]